MIPNPFPQQPEIEVTLKSQDDKDSNDSDSKVRLEEKYKKDTPKNVPKDYVDNYIVKKKDLKSIGSFAPSQVTSGKTSPKAKTSSRTASFHGQAPSSSQTSFKKRDLVAAS